MFTNHAVVAGLICCSLGLVGVVVGYFVQDVWIECPNCTTLHQDQTTEKGAQIDKVSAPPQLDLSSTLLQKVW